MGRYISEWYTPTSSTGTMPWGDGMRVSGILRVSARPTPPLNYYAPVDPRAQRKPSLKEGGEFTVKVETSHRGEPSSVC